MNYNENPRWSYSRFSTFEGCKLKYFYQYILSLSTTGKTNEFASKGLSIHEILEFMNSNKTYQELIDYAKTRIESNEVDTEKYPVLKALPRIFQWWKTYITDYEKQGWELQKEQWINGEISDENIVGALDNVLYNPKTNCYRITDFKTPKTASIGSYKNQLLLYAWMIGKKHGIPLNELPNKVELYLFFPLAGLTDEELTNEVTCNKNMLKNYKQVEYSSSDIKEVISKFENYINESNNYQWEKLNESSGEMSFACSFCDFCGMIPREEIGFYGCKATRDAGLFAKRSTKVLTKSESKNLKLKG